MSKKNVYHSIAEWAEAEYGIKTKKENKNNLEAQRKKFVGICPYCKQPCEYKKGTNVVACVNEKCKGKKVRDKYKPFFKLLSEKQMEVAQALFED